MVTKLVPQGRRITAGARHRGRWLSTGRWRAGVLGLPCLLAVLFVVSSASAITNGQLDTTHTNVGAGILVLPFGVSVGCSGSLVHPRVVLTAGHCTASAQEVIDSGLATLDRFKISFADSAFDPGNRHSVAAIVTHPELRRHTLPPGGGISIPSGSDIGAVVLTEPVTDITPVTLPSAGLLDTLMAEGALAQGPNGTRFTVVGYGRTLDFPPPEEVPIDGLRRSAESGYLGLMPSFLVLSQNQAAGFGGVAAGDSGGAVFWTDPSGNEIQVALNCCGDAARVAMHQAYRIDTQDSLDFIAGVIANIEND